MLLLSCLVSKRVHVFLIRAKLSRSIELSLFWTGFRPSSPKLTFSVKRDREVSNLSELNNSRRLTKHPPPLICRYWENMFSSGSLFNVRVKTYSYPCSESSYISIAYSPKVATKALEVYFVRKKHLKSVLKTQPNQIIFWRNQFSHYLNVLNC